MTISLGMKEASRHKFINLNVASEARWVKFEQYNFPVFADNDLNLELQRWFHCLRSQYFESNFLESTSPNKVHLQSLFVDRHYELLGEQTGNELKSRDRKLFGEGLTAEERRRPTAFNDEELFYMNRAAYNVFLNKQRASFEDFVRLLQGLQTGTLLQRCSVWLQLVSPDDAFIREGLEQALRFANVQKRPCEAKTEFNSTRAVVERIFKSDERKGALAGEEKKFSKERILQVMAISEEIKSYMSTVLQHTGSI